MCSRARSIQDPSETAQGQSVGGGAEIFVRVQKKEERMALLPKALNVDVESRRKKQMQINTRVMLKNLLMLANKTTSDLSMKEPRSMAESRTQQVHHDENAVTQNTFRRYQMLSGRKNRRTVPAVTLVAPSPRECSTNDVGCEDAADSVRGSTANSLASFTYSNNRLSVPPPLHHPLFSARPRRPAPRISLLNDGRSFGLASRRSSSKAVIITPQRDSSARIVRPKWYNMRATTVMWNKYYRHNFAENVKREVRKSARRSNIVITTVADLMPGQGEDAAKGQTWRPQSGAGGTRTWLRLGRRIRLI